MGSSGEFTGDMIMYSWHDVPGLQKFGTYQGNGSTDGPFIELGFRPAVILWKKTSEASDASWMLQDSTREPFNDGNRTVLVPNTSDAEVTDAHPTDFLSNGFKLRTSGAAYNDSGETFIYAAWAEAPSINLYGAQSNAR